MGVRGLKTFLERENQTWSINIGDEIKKWKKANGDETPKIVIDFLSLTHCVARKENDTIFGGRHQVTLNLWKELLEALKATGCSIVFFADLSIQKGKIDELLCRRNEKFNFYISLYELIDAGVTVDTITASVQERKGLTTKFNAMESLAENYGEFYRTVKYECDLELAQYAKRERAMAVITDDTDFLIFDGEWRLWMSGDVQITSSNQLLTTEFNRKALPKLCSLNQNQLPLFATLLGNDFTKVYNDQLYGFARRLGPLRTKFQNVAQYVRKFGNGALSMADAHSIAGRVFNDKNMATLIKQSIESYDTSVAPPTIDDPLEKKLLKTNMYRPYVGLMEKIQLVTMPFYDMYHSKHGIHFSVILAEWIKRKIGVLRQHNKEDSFKFVLLAKKRFDQDYLAHEESPIYPDFKIPALDQLYLGKNDDEILETKWKIFGWIMSLSDEMISKMKELPKKFLLICAVLYALVKKELINVKEADGILYTEWKVYENDTMNVEHPKTLAAKHVRASHLYNIIFAHVRVNFSVAGLLPMIQELLQFDGIYYQKLMEKMDKMNTDQHESFIAPIKEYRIYA